MNSLLLVALAWGTASVLAAAAFAYLMRHRRRDTPHPGIATPNNAAAGSSPTAQPDFTGRASADDATDRDLIPEQRCQEARRLATAVRASIPQPREPAAAERPTGSDSMTTGFGHIASSTATIAATSSSVAAGETSTLITESIAQ